MFIKRFKKRVLLRVLIPTFVFVAHNGFAINFVNEISPRNSERPKRQQTLYIVLHTTEAPDKSSLSSLKRYGEANYMVSTCGTVYRIIDHSRVSYHAGVSMWNGRTNIDKVSVGVEVVGYHNKSITQSQYRALKALISELQGMYRVADRNVLTHSMVAYGTPNKWHKDKHRGRKRCGMLFATDQVRYKLGLTDRYLFDPDVRAGRLTVADTYLHDVLYRKKISEPQPTPTASIEELSGQYDTHLIVKGKSPWDTVGAKCKLAETLYLFPDGKRSFANDISNWNKIPVGTKILVKKEFGSSDKQVVSAEENILMEQGRSTKSAKSELPSSTISFNGFYVTNIVVKGKSPWDIVGYKCKSEGTVYVFPDGKMYTVQDIKCWNKIPIGTKIIVPQERVEIEAVSLEKDVINVVSDVLTNAVAQDQIDIVDVINSVLTNALFQEQIDIIIEKAADVTNMYTFADALSGDSIVFSAKELLSSNNLFLVGDGIRDGSKVSLQDLESFKSETKVLVGYENKGILGAGKSAFDLVSYHWNKKDTLYYHPNKNTIITGDKIDERSMLKGTYLLLKKDTDL